MDMVDRLKSLHYEVTNRTMGNRVVFHHVPKCGGTSLGRALRKRYFLSQATVSPESSYRAFQAFTGRTDREKMLVDVLDLREQLFIYLLFEDVRCVSAHVRFSNAAHGLFGETYKFITLLRHPVERFLSHYEWSHGRVGAHASIEDEFTVFLDTGRAERMGASYVEFFAGLGKQQELRSDRSVAAAIENLGKLDVVGRLDDLEPFKASLQQTLGVKIGIGHNNRALIGGAEKQKELSAKVLAKVTSLCRPDMEVWEAIFPERGSAVVKIDSGRESV
jgi:hypothetical protein